MPSDFTRRVPPKRQQTLADLLRALHAEERRGPRAPSATSPVNRPTPARKPPRKEDDQDRRRRAARKALKQLKDN